MAKRFDIGNPMYIDPALVDSAHAPQYTQWLLERGDVVGAMKYAHGRGEELEPDTIRSCLSWNNPHMDDPDQFAIQFRDAYRIATERERIGVNEAVLSFFYEELVRDKEDDSDLWRKITAVGYDALLDLAELSQSPTDDIQAAAIFDGRLRLVTDRHRARNAPMLQMKAIDLAVRTSMSSNHWGDYVVGYLELGRVLPVDNDDHFFIGPRDYERALVYGEEDILWPGKLADEFVDEVQPYVADLSVQELPKNPSLVEMRALSKAFDKAGMSPRRRKVFARKFMEKGFPQYAIEQLEKAGEESLAGSLRKKLEKRLGF